ncbi:MAG TPA: GGDEF domain-containing protein, partial [Planctomycetaceae bacterium]
DRLAALAATDPLTELPNRRALRERLADALEAAGRAGRPVSLALLDVDRFKQFNDAFGHPAGDDVLRAFAALLRRASRSGDLPARFGGEEFAVLLPDADAREASAAAERLRGAIEGAAWPLRPVTASFGVATVFPPSQPDESVADVLIAAADAALYRSKAAGRNRVTHADEAFEGEAFGDEAFEEAAPADGRPRPAR